VVNHLESKQRRGIAGLWNTANHGRISGDLQTSRLLSCEFGGGEGGKQEGNPFQQSATGVGLLSSAVAINPLFGAVFDSFRFM